MLCDTDAVLPPGVNVRLVIHATQVNGGVSVVITSAGTDASVRTDDAIPHHPVNVLTLLSPPFGYVYAGAEVEVTLQIENIPSDVTLLQVYYGPAGNTLLCRYVSHVNDEYTCKVQRDTILDKDKSGFMLVLVDTDQVKTQTVDLLTGWKATIDSIEDVTEPYTPQLITIHGAGFTVSGMGPTTITYGPKLGTEYECNNMEYTDVQITCQIVSGAPCGEQAVETNAAISVLIVID